MHPRTRLLAFGEKAEFVACILAWPRFLFFFFFKLVRPEIVVVGVTGHVSADRDGLRFRFLNKENLAVAISPVVRNRPNSTRLVFIRRILSRVWVVGKGNKSSSGVRFYRDSLCVERFTGRT